MFVAGPGPSGQGNNMNINSDKKIVDITNEDPHGQAPGGQLRQEGNSMAILLSLGNFDLAEELWLLQEDKKRAWIAIEIQKLKEEGKRALRSRMIRV